jgi:DNA-binding transcriptional LysR family regulator
MPAVVRALTTGVPETAPQPHVARTTFRSWRASARTSRWWWSRKPPRAGIRHPGAPPARRSVRRRTSRTPWPGGARERSSSQASRGTSGWTTTPPAVGAGANLVEACHAAGFTPPFHVEAHDYPTAIAFVDAGIGITVLPGLAARNLPAGRGDRTGRWPDPANARSTPWSRRPLRTLRPPALSEVTAGVRQRGRSECEHQAVVEAMLRRLVTSCPPKPRKSPERAAEMTTLLMSASHCR